MSNIIEDRTIVLTNDQWVFLRNHLSARIQTLGNGDHVTAPPLDDITDKELADFDYESREDFEDDQEFLGGKREGRLHEPRLRAIFEAIFPGDNPWTGWKEAD